MESKTTSKTSSLKALLLRAWRERWSDLQWGINIKTVLPRGVSGDVYNLADCIMQQAVVGSGVNQLVLSYLRHSLSAQLVSHAAVLSQIAKFQLLQRQHCVSSLLDFLAGVLPGVTCCGKSEETQLACALLATTVWLLQVAQQLPTLQDKVDGILQPLLSSDFYLAMVCLARYVDPERYNELRMRCREVGELRGAETKEILAPLRNLQPLTFTAENQPDPGPGCLIQAWLAVRLIDNPGCGSVELGQRLRLLQTLSGISDARLAGEIMRGALLSLSDVKQTPYEVQWGAFAFLKVPRLLDQLSLAPGSVYKGVEYLLMHSPLLDAIDAHASCPSLECLLGELVKAQLLTETQSAELNARRQPLPLPKVDTTAGIPKVIICAEPALARILKTLLPTDYVKTQDALLSMLHKVLAGNSFELILAVATVQGQLGTLVQRLVRFNECSKQAADGARAQLFDISFLMLVAIVQSYGVRATLGAGASLENQPSATAVATASGGDTTDKLISTGATSPATAPTSPSNISVSLIKDSLLQRWATVCMVEADRPKAADDLLRLSDPATVDRLLRQFNAGEGEIVTGGDTGDGVDLGQVVFSMSGVMKEVLVAWEQGALSPPDVKRILDAVRGRMCCLPLAAAAWLCAYMRTAPQDTLLKPGNMMHQLLVPPQLSADEDSVRERWQLTSHIIGRMQTDIQLLPQLQRGTINSVNGTSSDRHLVSRQPATDKLKDAWLSTIDRGWLDNDSARALHCLAQTAGPRWFVSATLQHLLQLRYSDELKRGCDIALAAFHVNNVRACCVELLTHALPQLLLYYGLQPTQGNTASINSQASSIQLEQSPSSSVQTPSMPTLVEPQLGALAILCARVVYAAAAPVPSDSIVEQVGKRRRTELYSQTVVLDALKELLISLDAHLQEGHITPQTYFTFHLLQNLIQLRHNNEPQSTTPESTQAQQIKSTTSSSSNTTDRSVLAAVPQALMAQLLRTLPDLFTPKLLVRFYDVHTSQGRAQMARDLCVLRNYQLRHNI